MNSSQSKEELTKAPISIKERAVLVIVIGIIVGLGLPIGALFFSGHFSSVSSGLSKDQRILLEEVISNVRKEYVIDISEEELIEKAIFGMVRGLDEYSEYLDKKAYKNIKEFSLGRYGGVGLELNSDGENIKVISPLHDGPADRAGVIAGDLIVEIDGVSSPGRIRDKSRSNLRGPKGSNVSIKVRRKDFEDLLDFNLTRSDIEVKSVDLDFLEGSVGYLYISQFNGDTANEVMRATQQIKESFAETGLRGLILDLRNNPGGTLEAAVSVSNLFLNSGVIVSGLGRTEASNFTHFATEGDLVNGAPISVLVNEGSASAAEIVAGALQDHQRAIIVGVNTFGKGMVQTVLPLSGDKGIKLTTSRYFRPLGSPIDGQGISPDVFVFNNSSLDNNDGSIDTNIDNQLRAAFNAIKIKPIN